MICKPLVSHHLLVCVALVVCAARVKGLHLPEMFTGICDCWRTGDYIDMRMNYHLDNAMFCDDSLCDPTSPV